MRSTSSSRRRAPSARRSRLVGGAARTFGELQAKLGRGGPVSVVERAEERYAEYKSKAEAEMSELGPPLVYEAWLW